METRLVTALHQYPPCPHLHVAWFVKLNCSGDIEFEHLPVVFRPLLHTMLLVWTRSKFYNTPGRLATLIRCVCSAIIASGCRFVTGRGVWELLNDESGGGAPAAAVHKLRVVLHVASNFMKEYAEFKALSHVTSPENPWRLLGTAIFSRLDAYIRRVHDMLDVAIAVTQFSRLDRVLIGGVKGQALTARVAAVFTDFRAAASVLASVPYDALDVGADVHAAICAHDSAAFAGVVRELERRLASLLTQAFDDASGGTYARFKLLEIFSCVTERPLLAAEVERLHVALVAMVAADVRAVHELFLRQRDAPPIPLNMPPVAGAVYWARGLRERALEPVTKLRAAVSSAVLGVEEAREADNAFELLLVVLADFEAALLTQWGRDVAAVSVAKLSLPLFALLPDNTSTDGAPEAARAWLSRLATGGAPVPPIGANCIVGAGGNATAVEDGCDDSPSAPGTSCAGDAVLSAPPRSTPLRLVANFDPDLSALLHEVRHFILLRVEVPVVALDVHRAGKILRRQSVQLGVLAGLWNAILDELLPVEAPLLAVHFAAIRRSLARGVNDLSWRSGTAIDEFIESAGSLVRAAHGTLFALKAQRRDIIAELEAMANEPLFARKVKPLAVYEFDVYARLLRSARGAAIIDASKIIEKKLRESATLVRTAAASGAIRSGSSGATNSATVALAAEHWAAYVGYVQSVVVSWLSRLVAKSIQHLLDVLRAASAGAAFSGAATGTSSGVTMTPRKTGAIVGGGAVAAVGATVGGASAPVIVETPLLVIDLVLAGGVSLTAMLPGAAGLLYGDGITAASLEGTAIVPCVRFNPDLGRAADAPPSTGTDVASLAAVVAGWVDSFYATIGLFRRLDSGDGTYVKDVADDPAIRGLHAALCSELAATDEAAAALRVRFESFSFLWESEIRATVAAFAAAATAPLQKSNERLTAEHVADRATDAGIASSGNADEGEERLNVRGGSRIVQPNVPDLPRFEAEIRRYRELADAIGGLKTPVDVGFLRINAAPLKFALTSLAGAWSAAYTDHLIAYATSSTRDLSDFIESVTAGLAENVTRCVVVPADGSTAGDETAAVPDDAGLNDRAALRRVMTHVRDVREWAGVRKDSIGPLRRTLALLRKLSVPVSTLQFTRPLASGRGQIIVGVLAFLENADLAIDGVVNAAFAAKEAIFPLQTAEMMAVRGLVASFSDAVRETWAAFRRSAPFAFTGTVQEAYVLLDQFTAALDDIERDAATLRNTEDLFELSPSRHPEIAAQAAQICVLRTVWEFRERVNVTYDSWKAALWADIDTESLEDVNRKLAVGLKKLGDANPVAKGWAVYRDLDVNIRDMATVLPLIADLHSPAMRARHWVELATVCCVRALDPTHAQFSLEDILDLQLHAHADAVADVVDGAGKESKIERKMDEIEASWTSASLDYVPHKDGGEGGVGGSPATANVTSLAAPSAAPADGVRIVRASDELLENLDAHQMELQGIASQGRVMEFFRTRVVASQRALGIVECVLREWLNVTKSWSSLESIFLGSADIRAQLPDDTKRFEGIDAAFKELMRSATGTPNAVEACTKEGRGDVLRDMTKALELCQKSLNEYLDMKKKIFPRFYFVSNTALLDILSNGNNPPRVIPYLGDCYDSISDLVFDPPTGKFVPHASALPANHCVTARLPCIQTCS